jgi:UDP-N-acetylmuramate dehydrogenase
MTVADLIETGLMRRSVSLGPLTTYRFGGPAAWFAEPGSQAAFLDVLSAARELHVPVVMLGRGSNVVISDKGVEAVVVRLAGSFLEVHVGEDGIVEAGAAAPLARVARASVECDRGGLEFLVGIPGSVGGAVCMNAGCLGSETADWMLDARISDVATGVVRTATPSDLAMGYRTSLVGDGDAVLSARFRTESQAGDTGKSRIREVTQWRRNNQPGGTLNAGSVFKNPPGNAAGKIIDELGLKGLTIGAVRVSPRHANFFEAGDGATAQDVFSLVAEVKQRVASATGIELQPEVRFIGAFDQVAAT